MAVSHEVRRYYAEQIFAHMGRDRAPANFLPLDEPHTGYASVEGCLGGGKNITEFSLIADDEVIRDIRIACGLCNPAMYAAADIVVAWARGRSMDAILALDPHDVSALGPFFRALGGPAWPDDAREKFQYALAGVQNAIRDHRGASAVPVPEFDGPTDRDWADPDDDPAEARRPETNRDER